MGALRILAIVDAYTRECLSLDVAPCAATTSWRGWSCSSNDNGPAFTATAVRDHDPLHRPGSPWENGTDVESFNGTRRDECLNRERFDTLLEAQNIVAHPQLVGLLFRTNPADPRPPRQIDSMQNIVAHPQVGLLFLVPGMTETLRVSGTAEIVTDVELLAPLSVGGKPPLSGLRVTVEEAFLHCGRALIRSRLWDPEVQIERTCFPTYGQVLADQIKGANAAEINASEDEANRHRLY